MGTGTVKRASRERREGHQGRPHRGIQSPRAAELRVTPLCVYIGAKATVMRLILRNALNEFEATIGYGKYFVWSAALLGMSAGGMVQPFN